jgi:AcrR family transcriptional regulator
MTKTRQSYHHGNLRAALVEAALDVLENAGSAALSLRGIAAAAGVSRSAPYAHFEDRNDLLSAVANVGFERMAAAMASAADGGSTPRDRFTLLGRAYVRFALDHPNLFKLMFSAELGSRADQSDIEGSQSFTLLRESLAALLPASRVSSRNSVIEASAWSMVHGLSLLLIEERLPVPRSDHDAFVEQVTSGFTQLLER